MSRPVIVQVFLSRPSVEVGGSLNLESPARMRKLLNASGVDSVLTCMRSESPPLPQIVTSSRNAVGAKKAEQ
jgi:hypothetical protein